MQDAHFWYRGRHRFLLAALERHLGRLALPAGTLNAVDLGAGCGGWVDYLLRHSSLRFRELSLADSSPKALQFAGAVAGSRVRRFQVDLLDLGWQDRWDVVFLLDVLEHIPDQNAVMKQIHDCLAPNGLLFLTAPALNCFWSYVDVLARHQRRYSVRDLKSLADQCGLALLEARYFMFFLSPLSYLTRFRRPRLESASADERRKLLEQALRVPAKPINALLRFIFSMETPLGHWAPFPWGTSVLGVFQKK